MHQKRIRIFAIATLACATLSACDAPQVIKAGTTTPTPTVDAFAQRFMDTIQAASIAENREFCGYFVRNGGQLAATAPRRGTEARCQYGPMPANSVASYHTHGSYGPEYDNEVPSGFDLRNAQEFGLNDYVSTPGGRLWRVEGGTGNATQLCGLGCLTYDPNFVPRNEGDVAQSYTIQSMRARQAS